MSPVPGHSDQRWEDNELICTCTWCHRECRVDKGFMLEAMRMHNMDMTIDINVTCAPCVIEHGI